MRYDYNIYSIYSLQYLSVFCQIFIVIQTENQYLQNITKDFHTGKHAKTGISQEICEKCLQNKNKIV